MISVYLEAYKTYIPQRRGKKFEEKKLRLQAKKKALKPIPKPNFGLTLLATGQNVTTTNLCGPGKGRGQVKTRMHTLQDDERLWNYATE